MNKILTFTAAVLIVVILFITCKKQDPASENIDQPISVSVTIDGTTSVEAGVR